MCGKLKERVKRDGELVVLADGGSSHVHAVLLHDARVEQGGGGRVQTAPKKREPAHTHTPRHLLAAANGFGAKMQRAVTEARVYPHQLAISLFPAPSLLLLLQLASSALILWCGAARSRRCLPCQCAVCAARTRDRAQTRVLGHACYAFTRAFGSHPGRVSLTGSSA